MPFSKATEQFFVNLSGATDGVTIADGQGVGTITDNDSPPMIEPATFILSSDPQNGDEVGQVVASDADGNIPASGAFAIIGGDPPVPLQSAMTAPL